MLPKEYEVKGKNFIVSASARGIGKGIVEVLASSGAQVLATAISNTYLEKFSKYMKEKGFPIETIVADATKSEDWEKTVNYALNKWDNIDGLINNLGDFIKKPLISVQDGVETLMSDDEWKYILDLNLTQAFLGCRAISSHFIKQQKGKIINISGVAARKGVPNALAYSVSKAALVQLTQTLALEWAQYNINVNCIAPGSFPDPNMSNDIQTQEYTKNASIQIPLKRVGSLQEVGYLALYLLSDASDYITGETIYIDGGLSQTHLYIDGVLDKN